MVSQINGHIMFAQAATTPFFAVGHALQDGMHGFLRPSSMDWSLNEAAACYATWLMHVFICQAWISPILIFWWDFWMFIGKKLRLAFIICVQCPKTRTLHARTPATNLSGELMGDLALLWCAISWKIIKNRGCQSLFILFFHVFGPKNTQISSIFYLVEGGVSKSWLIMLQKAGFSGSHDKIWCFPTDLRCWDHFEFFWTTFLIFEISIWKRATKGSDPSPCKPGISRVKVSLKTW